MNKIRTDQKERSVESITKNIRQASPWDKPQQEVSAPEHPVTLHPPTLTQDDTEVTCAQKHHLKKQNKL